MTANTKYAINGVTVNEKIIPDGTRWKDAAKANRAGFSVGDLYKKNQKIGKVQSVTIHNTSDLPNILDDGKQYTLATFNENMDSARVHFYVDDTGAWQNLKAGTGMSPNDPEGSAEVSWHAGDGSMVTGGNMTSLSMEIIMGEGTEQDAKAKDNGARIAAWLLWKHGLPISRLLTHTYWVNQLARKTFADVDDQCTNLIVGQKWCPAYIFDSYEHSVAKKNWQTFKALVKSYLDNLNGVAHQKKTGTLYRVQTGAFRLKLNADRLANELKAKGFATYIVCVDGLYKVQVGAFKVKANADAFEAKLKAAGYSTFITTEDVATFRVGDTVKCNEGVTKYADGTKMASWVSAAVLYVRKIEQDGAVLLVSIEPIDEVYTGCVYASDVHKI